jgi:hypothetical protein
MSVPGDEAPGWALDDEEPAWERGNQEPGWVRRYRWILLIVIATLIAAAVSSFFEVKAGQNLSTILTGDVLVVSVAIFAAAVTAAIYAKPAFESARALAEPPRITVQAITVAQDGSDLTWRVGEDSRIIFTAPTRSAPIKVTVAVNSDDPWPRPTYCNILAASPCQLNAVSPKSLSTLPDEPSYLLLLDESPIAVAVVGGDHEVTEAAITRFIAELTVPDERSHWPNGWPVRMTLTANNRRGFVIDETWWITTIDEHEVATLRKEAAELEGKASELRERSERYEHLVEEGD